MALQSEYIKSEFSLHYNPLDNGRFLCTIDEKDNFVEFNCGPNKIEEVLLKYTQWEGMFNLYFSYRPTITVIHHGQEMPYITQGIRD